MQDSAKLSPPESDFKKEIHRVRPDLRSVLTAHMFFIALSHFSAELQSHPSLQEMPCHGEDWNYSSHFVPQRCCHQPHVPFNIHHIYHWRSKGEDSSYSRVTSTSESAALDISWSCCYRFQENATRGLYPRDCSSSSPWIPILHNWHVLYRSRRPTKFRFI